MPTRSPRHNAPTFNFRQLARNTAHDIRHIISILREDPELHGPDGNGAWRLSASPAFSRLEAVLNALHLSLHDKAADITDSFGHVEALPRSGETTATLLLTRAPTLCQGVLELTALATRWPGCDTWLPCEERRGGLPATAPPAAHLRSQRCGSEASSGAAAPAAEVGTEQATGATSASRRALVIRLLQLRTHLLDLLMKLLQLGPMEPSSRLACTLLRMHTLQACSRSVAHTVERLIAAQPQPGIRAQSQADTAPVGGPTGLAASARETSAAGSGSSSGAHSCGSDVVEGPMEALHGVVTCAVLVLQAFGFLLGRLEGCPGPDASSSAKGEGGGPAASANSITSNSAVTASSSGNACAKGSGGSGSGSGPSPGAGGSSSHTLVGLLREALPGSAVFEHAARGVLHLVHARYRSVYPLLEGLVHAYRTWAEHLLRLGLGDVRGAVLGGPCATYLVSAAGLQLLCTADGGRSYGMQPLAADEDLEFQWLHGAGEGPGMGAGGSREGAVQGGSGVRRMDVVLLVSLAHALSLGERKRRSGADIFLRLGKLAVAASALHGGGGGGDGGDGGGGGGGSGSSVPVARQRYTMDSNGAAYLASMALRRYRGHLELFSGRGRQAADVEGWRLACALTRVLPGGVHSTLVRRVAADLHVNVGPLPTEESLPAAPPPALSAALSGGLLPCLERMMRRAGAAAGGNSPALQPCADPWATEQLLLQHFLCTYGGEPFLGWLLAYGELSKAAALVDTVGKLLREGLAGRVLFGAAGPERDRVRASVAQAVAHEACRALWDARMCVVAGARDGNGDMGVAAGAGAPEEGQQGPAEQLRRVAVLAACEWLPSLWEVVTEAARHVVAARPDQSQAPALQAGGALMRTAAACLNACMSWHPMGAGDAGKAEAPVMASTAAPSPVQSATTAAQEAAAAASGELGRCRLRQLAQEVPPVELVGAGMTLMAHVAAGGNLDGTDENMLAYCRRLCKQLLSAGYVLAATSPDAVCRAVACGGAAAASDGGVPAHCTWRSSNVRQLMERLPCDFAEGTRLAGALEAWERGAGEAVGVHEHFRTPYATLVDGSGLLEVIGPELEQPSPLRRCSWWRCTNLAGDSEAGLPLQACARCGGAWYCGRGCQVAHWRAGHKGECGSGVGGGERGTEQV